MASSREETEELGNTLSTGVLQRILVMHRISVIVEEVCPNSPARATADAPAAC